MLCMSKRGELKHLSTHRRREQFSDSLSSGDRTGTSPNHSCFGKSGVVGLQHVTGGNEQK